MGQSPRILLVEDHGDTARILRRLLQKAGCRVAHAGDVATALQLADSQSFDLILSDLGLPDRSGVELMQELRSQGRSTPAIAISGYGMEDDVRRSRQAGFDDHLTKPVNVRHLFNTIEAVLQRPR
jgi:DNA-binding response OmpR family regulator